MKIYTVGLATALPDTEAGRVAEARGACAATALPCLNTNNCNGEKEKLSTSHRKTAYALKVNVMLMIERHGLGKVGFLTLTFARQVVAYKEAQKAWHSLMSGVLRLRYAEYITVMERMTSKRIHYHLLVVVAEDIRTGFDFAAVQRGDYQSASPYLRREWAFWRLTAPKYGFGRTELLPIKKTAEGVAKYVGKYIAKHLHQRLPEDKGARLVRYSKQARRVGVRFDWVSAGAFIWRAKLAAFCTLLNLTSDNYKTSLKEWFGRNWIYHLMPIIQSIKPPALYPEGEAMASLRAAWITTVNERERRWQGKRHRDQRKPFPEAPAKVTWTSWLDHTAKEAGGTP